MIDSHVHIWRIGRNGCAWPPPELAAIHRDHLMTEAARTVADAGVARFVLVQSQESEDDTSWLLAEAASSMVAGVVGWIDPGAIDPAVRIARLLRQGPLVGLRIMAQGYPPERLADPALHPALECLSYMGLSLDLLLKPQHIGVGAGLAARFPGLRMVIDHGAKPAVGGDGFDAWRDDMARAAERPNVYCKLSGLSTEAPPGAPLEMIAPHIAALLDLFGPGRLIWGSDWPVVNMNADYGGWLDFARASIPAAHHDAVFGGNARAFYRLSA